MTATLATNPMMSFDTIVSQAGPQYEYHSATCGRSCNRPVAVRQKKRLEVKRSRLRAYMECSGMPGPDVCTARGGLVCIPAVAGFNLSARDRSAVAEWS